MHPQSWISRTVVPAASAVALLLESASAQQKAETAFSSPAQPFGVTVRGDRLVFESIAAYKAVMDNPTPALQADVLSHVNSLPGFLSDAEAFGAHSIIADDYLSSLLNVDQVVQIGEYIIKVDPSIESVFVLHSVFEDECEDLAVGRTANPHIRRFSTDDDVLELLSTGGSSSFESVVGPAPPAAAFSPGGSLSASLQLLGWKWLKSIIKPVLCKESGAGATSSSTPTYLVDANTVMSGQVEYNKYGIFVSLHADMGFASAITFSPWIPSIYLEPVQYHVRCGSDVGPYNVNGYSSGATQNGLKYQSYKNVKALNKLYMRGKFRMTHAISGIYVETDWVQIKKNY